MFLYKLRGVEFQKTDKKSNQKTLKRPFVRCIMSNFFDKHAVVVFSSKQNSLNYSSTVENDKKIQSELYNKKKRKENVT